MAAAHKCYMAQNSYAAVMAGGATGSQRAVGAHSGRSRYLSGTFTWQQNSKCYMAQWQGVPQAHSIRQHDSKRTQPGYNKDCRSTICVCVCVCVCVCMCVCVCVCRQAAVQHARDPADYSSAFHLLTQGLTDRKERVRTVALEGMAALAHALGHTQLHAMLQGSSLSDAQRQQITNRIQRNDYPTVTVDGIVNHVMENGENGYENGPPDLLPSGVRLTGGGAGGGGGGGGIQSGSSSAVSSPIRLPWEAGVPRPRARQTLEPWLDGVSSGGASSELPTVTSRRATQESAAPERSDGGAGRHRPAQRSWLAESSSDGPPGLISTAAAATAATTGVSSLSHSSSYQPTQTHTASTAGATSQGGAGSGGGGSYSVVSSRSVISLSAPNPPAQPVQQPLQPTPGWPPPLPWGSSAAQSGGGAAPGSLSGYQPSVGEFPLAPITIKRQIPSLSDSKAQVSIYPACRAPALNYSMPQYR